ncbi:MAG TPA: ATP-binding protein [Acidimicrobiia bacterium]|nr:ATP-binding protein [Acidimicrobiia bacterium]
MPKPRWLEEDAGIDARPDPLIDYHVRAVRAGVLATYLIIPLLALYPFLPGRSDVDRPVYFALLFIAIVGSGVVHSLPWRSLFEAGIGDGLRYAWSVLDILIITGAMEVAGGPDSPLFGIYALTTVFFAASYPRRGQLALLLFTSVSYASLFPGSGIEADEVVARLGILSVLAFLGSFLSGELMGQMAAHARARAEADRRAELLGAVAGAGGALSVLDPDRVLTGVVDAAGRLGFDAADLCMIHDDGIRYEVVRSRGLPASYTTRVHSSREGLVGRVLGLRRTVVADYLDVEDGAPDLRGSGFRAVVATPVWVQGQLCAVLEAGSKERVGVTAEEVEALELLAAQAGRALENARRFEDERRMVERLAELDRLKNDFVSTASHELRTPLTVVLGMTTTLEHRWNSLDEASRQRLVERVHANASRLEEIVDSLLDFARLDAGDVEVERERIDLGVVAQGAAERLAPLFADRPLAVDAEARLPVLGDRRMLDRVFENLLGNAAKHTPPGTAVRITAVRSGDEVVVEVTDEGPGISTDELSHLGERFFRGGETNTRETRGLGLGLAIVREILGRHGSTLEVESVPGHGSCFRFRLPLAHAPAPVASEDVRPS